MENVFTEALTNEINNEKILSENGADMNATTGNKLLDCWYKLSSMRNMEEFEISRMFSEAFYENERLAKRFMFYVLDMRGGAGERRTFKTMFSWIVNNRTDEASKLVSLIPYYGRWDILVDFLGSSIDETVFNIIVKQLTEDLKNEKDGKDISLLAKWMPSINTSSEKKRQMACSLSCRMKMSPKKYRKMLSRLRKKINIVERQISANNWGDVDYSTVPSKANILYKDAFLRHDTERRNKFLNDLQNEENGVKINSSVCFPHDIVHKYCPSLNLEYGNPYAIIDRDDIALEEMWKSLPNYVNGDETTIVVHDSSGSMTDCVGGGTLTAYEVATSLAIYFSERCRGAYKDKFITFSENPKYIDLSKCKTLREKLNYIFSWSECANTNIARTMDLILDVAVKNNLKESDIPRILIISDMEFDYQVKCCDENGYGIDDTVLMKQIEKKFNNAGYKMPKISYWNVCNRSGGIPCTSRDSGVSIVSGFSPSAIKMVLSNKDSPYDALCEVLNDKRYDKVDC